MLEEEPFAWKAEPSQEKALAWGVRPLQVQIG